MKLSHITKVMAGGSSFADEKHVANVLPRYAAMAGLEIMQTQVYHCKSDPAQDMDISAELARQILAFDFAERATGDLRAMGEGMGKLSVNIPSNINVWQHLKGETALANAAKGLMDAVEVLAKR